MNRSNNNIMWDCMIDIFKGRYGSATYNKIYEFCKSYSENNGREVEFNFSHDNMMTVLCFLHKFEYRKSRLPLFGNHSRHPMRFIMFAWMKYPYLLFPLRLITILDIIVKHGIIRRKTSAGNYHTSGLLLSYYRAYSYNQKYTMWILTKLMKTMFKDWEEVFYRYHGESEMLEAFKGSKSS